MNGGTVRIDRGGVDSPQPPSSRFQRQFRVDIDLEILLHDVKGNRITKLQNRHEIAHLLPLANPPLLPLPSDHSAIDAMPRFGGQSLAYSLARMEESCHGRANGSDSATTGSRHHVENGKMGLIANNPVQYLRIPM